VEQNGSLEMLDSFEALHEFGKLAKEIRLY
jgi:hypothetical protein